MVFTEMEPEQSNRTMKAPRNPTGVFKILCKCFNEAIIFTAFSENNILAGYALNLLLNIIPKMEVFQIQYEEWHNLPDNKTTLVNSMEW